MVEIPQVGRLAQRFRRVTAEELAPVHPRLIVANVLAALLPEQAASRARTALLRLAGFRIGRGALLFGRCTITGVGPIRDRLHIGADALINAGCRFELNDHITIGERVSIGHDVMLLTMTHRIGGVERRAGANVTAPISIGEGTWIGSRSVILPGVTIGAGAVVAAGSVVAKDVPAHCLVSGVPAVVAVKRLPGAPRAKAGGSTTGATPADLTVASVDVAPGTGG